MCKIILCKTYVQNFPPHLLWKTLSYPHLGCVKKVVASLEENPLFHIILYYSYCYYLNLLFLYINIYL